MVGKKDTAGTANAVAAFHHVVAKGDLEKVKDFALVAAPYAFGKECTSIFILHTHTSTHTRMHKTYFLLYIYIKCAYMYTAKKRPVRSECNHSPVWLPPRRSVSSGSFVGGSGCSEGLLLCAGRRAKAGPYTNSRQLAGRRRVSSYPLGGNARSRARSIVSRSCGCSLVLDQLRGPFVTTCVHSWCRAYTLAAARHSKHWDAFIAKCEANIDSVYILLIACAGHKNVLKYLIETAPENNRADPTVLDKHGT